MIGLMTLFLYMVVILEPSTSRALSRYPKLLKTNAEL
ncbi:MAG: hypothetical protein BWX68_02004 [Verrucomicrobia bacterium ADurb.Bin063]|nr:MAG: hypothetical protein BWX68_02004 [Verrucomicrobia bacterium ADurb.Bin063]